MPSLPSWGGMDVPSCFTRTFRLLTHAVITSSLFRRMCATQDNKKQYVRLNHLVETLASQGHVCYGFKHKHILLLGFTAPLSLFVLL